MVTLSIGKSTYDITVPMEEYPVENSKILLKEKLESGGGAASNVAYLFGKWKVDSYFAGIVGYDDIGSFVKKELDSVNVHTQFMEINYEKKTTMSFILASKKNSTRTSLVIEPEPYHLKKYDYDLIPDLIYSDGYEYSATQGAFNKYPKAISVLGAGLNTSDPKEVEALAKYAKYVIFSLEFACRVTKMKIDMNQPVTLLNLYKELKEKYPHSTNIITLHQDGVLYEFNSEVKVMPTITVTELDRTGAGDIFDGAFCYGLLKGYDMEKCLRLANISGALSTTKYGAKPSIPLISDVISEYEKKFGSLDAPFENPMPTNENLVQDVNHTTGNTVVNETNQNFSENILPTSNVPQTPVSPSIVIPTMKQESGSATLVSESVQPSMPSSTGQVLTNPNNGAMNTPSANSNQGMMQ